MPARESKNRVRSSIAIVLALNLLVISIASSQEPIASVMSNAFDTYVVNSAAMFSDAFSIYTANPEVMLNSDSFAISLYSLFLHLHSSYAQIAITPIQSTVTSSPATVNVTHTPASTTLLSFSVEYQKRFFTVSLKAPLFTYNDTIGQIEPTLFTWYPNINQNILEQAYYVWHHVENPNLYPLMYESVTENDHTTADETLAIQLVDELLQYCLELFDAAWPAKLDSYHSLGEAWSEAHDELALAVGLSDLLSRSSHLLTIIGPIIGSIRHMYSDITSEELEGAISLMFELCNGVNRLNEVYGAVQADAITDVLISQGLISSVPYNSFELYEELVNDPSRAVQALEQINSEVFSRAYDANARTILFDFLTEMKTRTLGSFAVGTVIGLHAYFASGLSTALAAQLGVGAFWASFLGYAIPLALASAISEGYILPMAEALHAAWEDMGYMAEMYFQMNLLGERIASPEGNMFNLTDSRAFTALYGVLCISEYHYYMNSYFYRSRQLFDVWNWRVVDQSELDGLEDSAELTLSHGMEWAEILGNIQDYATAIVHSTDPEGSVFNFPLLPDTTLLPTIRESSKGFVLTANSTASIQMLSGALAFLVENRTWHSNFTDAFYVDDIHGAAFLILSNPPEQDYTVNVDDNVNVVLKNFDFSNGNVTVTEVGANTGPTSFTVANSYVDPLSIGPTEPSEPPPIFTPAILILIVVIALLVVALLVIYRKKRIATQTEVSP